MTRAINVPPTRATATTADARNTASMAVVSETIGRVMRRLMSHATTTPAASSARLMNEILINVLRARDSTAEEGTSSTMLHGVPRTGRSAARIGSDTFAR